ncbi:carbon starvation protein [Desulfatibacillum alkenivorans DSM 16219]|jgi:carbon starvation protein|uniref:Carbon starvation protein n=1 Tax=Desulfatibacillum alkenivorans DSM 16219 TaxID=1121393 RepID=A0A1M6T3K8_9BACT|nr:carbon starvation protein A [Desulfatibacillum alkenivorans]SHK51476.1 carbon starvation protein [Desulfatibacillum alkenivorans DSM 16219]
MNAFIVMALVLAWFYAGYRFYGTWVERNLVKPDDARPTPAYEFEDGVDYSPAKVSFLWGHHFSSIAGAGPIIGPILATAWFGWASAILWIAIGCVFIGAVHDYLSLMLSVRHQGRGISEVAGDTLGNVTRLSFGILIWITLVFIIAVFAVSAANALANMPELVIPTFGVCFVAVLLGLAVYKLKINAVLASIGAVFLSYFLIYVGYNYPIALDGWSHASKVMLYLNLLMGYCLIASMLPVWVLLQPRDFISSVKLFVGLFLGLLGVLAARPDFTAPAFITGSDKPMWPIMFITLACGAVSGFHCLVGTGTTSKQLDKESHGKVVGYGGMIMEGVLAALVVVVVGAGLKWGQAPAGEAAGLYFASSLEQGWIVAFSNGFGAIVGDAGLPFLSAAVAALLGGVMVKTFVMTSLDTSTRLGRFIFMETLFSSVKFLRRTFVATMGTLAPAYYLAATGNWKNIWKLFGASNQLIAAISLLVITAWLAQRRRAIAPVIFPALFMVATTIGALGWSVFNKNGYLGAGPGHDLMLGVISLALIALALVIACSAAFSLLKDKGAEKRRETDSEASA